MTDCLKVMARAVGGRARWAVARNLLAPHLPRAPRDLGDQALQEDAEPFSSRPPCPQDQEKHCDWFPETMILPHLVSELCAAEIPVGDLPGAPRRQGRAQVVARAPARVQRPSSGGESTDGQRPQSRSRCFLTCLASRPRKTRDALCFGTKRESFDPELPAQIATRALPPTPAADCGHSGVDGMPRIGC